jgi:DHA1 family multidrug resistance protein B-like MFS transporter
MSSDHDRRAPTVRLRDLHPTLRLRIGLAFFERALNTMAIPLMAIYLSQQLGARAAGLLIIVSVVVAVLAGLCSGHVADLFGRRRALLLGSAAMAIGFGGMAAAAGPWWSSPLTVFAFYVLQVAAASFIQPVHDTVIIDVTAPEQRKAAFTINYWSFNIAMAGGALLCGFLYRDHFVDLLIGAAACGAVATLITYRFLGETAPQASGSDAAGDRAGIRSILAGYALPLRNRRFMVLMLAMTLVLGLEMQRTSGFVALRLAEDVPTQGLLPFGIGPSVTGIQLLGILQAVNTVGVAVLALFSHRVLRRLDDRRSVVIGLALFTAGCAALAVGDLAVVLLVAMLVITVGELMHIPAMQTVLASVVPDNARSRYMAVFNLNMRGGMVIASLSLSAGTLLSNAGMACLYVGLGAGAVLLYRSLWSTPAPSPLVTPIAVPAPAPEAAEHGTAPRPREESVTCT